MNRKPLPRALLHVRKMLLLLFWGAAFAGDFGAQNSDGVLYYQKIPDGLLSWIQSEIQFMDKGKAIQWDARRGGKRKNFEFGFSFKEIEVNRKMVRYDIPPFLLEARRQIVGLFKDQLKEKDPEKFVSCIISLYSEGEWIQSHNDMNYFGPDILGLIVVPDTSADPNRPASCLYFTKKSKEPIFVSEEAGVAYLITGKLRSDWNHQLDPVVTERISIQFRTLDEENLSRHIHGMK
jgi:hypothetical protein